MDIEVLEDGFPDVYAAANSEYRTFRSAYEAIQEPVLTIVDAMDAEGFEEPAEIGYVRDFFFGGLRDGEEFTLGEYALAAMIFDNEMRTGGDYEFNAEGFDNADNPYVALPELLLKRAAETDDAQVRLACLAIVNALLGMVRATIMSDVRIFGDDGCDHIIMPHATIDAILSTVKENPIIMETINSSDIDLLENLHFFTSSDAWREKMVDFRHPSEEQVFVDPVGGETPEA